MLTGDLGVVAVAARSGGRDALDGIGLELLRPVQPMLAVTAPSLAELTSAAYFAITPVS